MQSYASRNQCDRDSDDERDSSVERRSGGGGSKEERRSTNNDKHKAQYPNIRKNPGNAGRVPSPETEKHHEKKEKGKGKETEKGTNVSVDLSGNNTGGRGGKGGKGTGGNGTGGNGTATGGESSNSSHIKASNKRKRDSKDDGEHGKLKKRSSDLPSAEELPLLLPNPNPNPNPIPKFRPLPDDTTQGEASFFYFTGLKTVFYVIDQDLEEGFQQMNPPPTDDFLEKLAAKSHQGKKEKPDKDVKKWELSTKFNLVVSDECKDFFQKRWDNKYKRGYNKIVAHLRNLRDDRNDSFHKGTCDYSRCVISIFLSLMCLQSIFGVQLLEYLEESSSKIFHHILFKCMLGRNLQIEEEMERQRMLEHFHAKIKEMEDKLGGKLEKMPTEVKFRDRLQANEVALAEQMKDNDMKVSSLQEQVASFQKQNEEQVAFLRKQNEEQMASLSSLQKQNNEQMTSLTSLQKRHEEQVTSMRNQNEMLLVQLTQMNSTMSTLVAKLSPK